MFGSGIEYRANRSAMVPPPVISHPASTSSRAASAAMRATRAAGCRCRSSVAAVSSRARLWWLAYSLRISSACRSLSNMWPFTDLISRRFHSEFTGPGSIPQFSLTRCRAVGTCPPQRPFSNSTSLRSFVCASSTVASAVNIFVVSQQRFCRTTSYAPGYVSIQRRTRNTRLEQHHDEQRNQPGAGVQKRKPGP